jgi:predicted patatin/cPLA2 family phospholipase
MELKMKKFVLAVLVCLSVVLTGCCAKIDKPQTPTYSKEEMREFLELCDELEEWHSKYENQKESEKERAKEQKERAKEERKRAKTERNTKVKGDLK